LISYKKESGKGNSNLEDWKQLSLPSSFPCRHVNPISAQPSAPKDKNSGSLESCKFSNK
jgi:hypothetical protein